MTPHETSLYCLEAVSRDVEAYKLSLFGSWHAAAFSRQKRLQNLQSILSQFDKARRKGKKQTAEEIRTGMLNMLEFAKARGAAKRIK